MSDRPNVDSQYQRRVLVTGACSGIGHATAHHLVDQYHVIAIGRDFDLLEQLARQIGCTILAVDLSDSDAARSAAESLLPFDALVNCAGIVETADFVDTSPESFDRTMAVNTRAPMILAQVMVRHLMESRKSGVIVNVSSIAAQVGTPRHAAYCASKAALDALTRVMAMELGSLGIRVNSVNPVVTLTPMAERVWSDPARAAPMLARIPLGHFAQSQDIASVIAFLLSDEAAMIHGTCIDVDGGFRAG